MLPSRLSGLDSSVVSLGSKGECRISAESAGEKSMAEDKPFLSDKAQYLIGGILSVVIAVAYILLTEERSPGTSEVTIQENLESQNEKVKE